MDCSVRLSMKLVRRTILWWCSTFIPFHVYCSTPLSYVADLSAAPFAQSSAFLPCGARGKYMSQSPLPRCSGRLYSIAVACPLSSIGRVFLRLSSSNSLAVMMFMLRLCSSAASTALRHVSIWAGVRFIRNSPFLLLMPSYTRAVTPCMRAIWCRRFHFHCDIGSMGVSSSNVPLRSSLMKFLSTTSISFL